MHFLVSFAVLVLWWCLGRERGECLSVGVRGCECLIERVCDRACVFVCFLCGPCCVPFPAFSN